MQLIAQVPGAIAAGVTKVLTWASFDNSDPSVFATGDYASGVIQNAVGDDAVFIRKPGLLLIAATAQAAAPGGSDLWNAAYMAGTVGSQPMFLPLRQLAAVNLSTKSGLGMLPLPAFFGTTTPYKGRVTIANVSGAGINIGSYVQQVTWMPFESRPVVSVY